MIFIVKCDVCRDDTLKIMNAENEVTVDILKKRFESFQNSKKTGLHELEDRRNEKNANKRNIKRTPAFRRDINISKKFVDHHSNALAVNNVKKFNNSNSSSSKCNKISETNSPSYKTDGLNQKLPLNLLLKDDNNKLLVDQKVLIQSLKKKIENNSTVGCQPKVLKKNIEHTLNTPLPVGPPPKKPPRTFTHEKQGNPDLPFKDSMETHKNSKSDPKILLKKLEKFVAKNSHTYGTKDDKSVEQDKNSSKSSKNLFNLAKSLKTLENPKVYDSSLNIYHTDEQNYLTTKSCNENDTEHIYDEPVFVIPNSRLNINGVDNCKTLIGDTWVCDPDKTNLHYAVSS